MMMVKYAKQPGSALNILRGPQPSWVQSGIVQHHKGGEIINWAIVVADWPSTTTTTTIKRNKTSDIIKVALFLFFSRIFLSFSVCLFSHAAFTLDLAHHPSQFINDDGPLFLYFFPAKRDSNDLLNYLPAAYYMIDFLSILITAT